MTDLYKAFISYGRADSKEFATKLYSKLSEQGLKIWLDNNDIPLGVDFQTQIYDGIEKADNFIFIISPHSVNSPYCLKEILHALKYNKRIIPLLHVEEITPQIWQERNIQATLEDWDNYQEQGLHSSFPNMHPEIAKINWIYARENIEEFDKAFANLIALLQHHQDYLRKHTEILIQALNWEHHQKSNSYLLFTPERQQAEAWLKIKFENEQPPCLPTDLQCEFICESIKNSNNLRCQVFISYSEIDKHFLEIIRKKLMRESITVWTNKTDITSGKDFIEEIKCGIEGADNLVYLLSPNSIKSEYCQLELYRALETNKRIIPVEIAPLNSTEIPEAIKNLQFIDFTDTENQELALDKLLAIFNQDAIYYEDHKNVLVKALKWQTQNHNPSILLRGYNLGHYQSWLAVARKRSLHFPIPLQIEFIEASAQQPANVAVDVFISYSRKDSDFARQLNEGLILQGKFTWFDQENIASGTEFQQEIYRGIEQSDNFIFIISSNSINSPYCADEVEYAKKLNKRFVTILYKSVNPANLHPELAKVQWIDFNKYNRDFYANFSELIRTLDSDREYVREHTKWSHRSRDWQQAQKSKDLLLRGSEAVRAYHWLETAKQQNKQPPPTELLIEYLNKSQAEEERQRQEEEKRQQRELEQERKALREAQRRNGLAVIATVLLTGLSIYAFSQQQLARHQTKIAWSSELAHQSELLKDKQGSLLLALESIRLFLKIEGQPKLEADRALRDSLAQLPNFAAWINHEGPVLTAIVSPDGRYIASGSKDNSARVWVLATGQEMMRAIHHNWVLAVAFSPDGKYLATASRDNTARVWELATGKEVYRLQHGNAVEAIAFSPDGKYLATASRDNTARLWEVATGKAISQMKHNNWVLALAFSPDGQYLATASKDNLARLWQLSGGAVTEMKHDNWVLALAFSPDGKYLATASSDDTARLWEVATGKVVATLKHDRSVLSVTFSPDGKYLATASEDKMAKVWETATGSEVARMKHDNSVLAVAFSPDGKYIATASDDNTARVWELAGAEKIANKVATIPHDNSVRAVAFSPDSQYLVTASDDETVRVWQKDRKERLNSIKHDSAVEAIAFSPDGKYFATASEDSTAKVLLLPSGKAVATLKHDDSLTDVTFSPDSKYIATASKDNTARVWETASGKQIYSLVREEWVWDVAFGPDGKYLATASDDNTARVWESLTGKEVMRANHDNAVRAVVFRPDGKYLATASDDNTARLWEVSDTGKQLDALEGHTEKLMALAFSPDGTCLATAGTDSTARLWDVDSGEQLVMLEGHTSGVMALAFSPDGTRLATASWDDTARLWDVDSGEAARHARTPHQRMSWRGVLRTDGTRLATASDRAKRLAGCG